MPAANKIFRHLAVALSCLLALVYAPTMQAQSSGPSVHPLVITILEGEGSLNNIRQRTAREPIVEVDDENHKPIAGAAVLFLLPSSGPSATFADGAQTLSMTTDTAGRVAIQGMRPNDIPGSFNIQVRVSYNGSTAQATIHQKNVSGQSSESQNNNTSEVRTVSAHVGHGISTKAMLLILGGAAGAGAVAAIILTRGTNSAVISAGTPTIGAPAPAVAAGGISFSLRRHGR